MGHCRTVCVGSETVAGTKQLARWWTRASELPVLHEKDFPAILRHNDIRGEFEPIEVYVPPRIEEEDTDTITQRTPQDHIT
jgi:hypothetical protein